jgi:3'-phosphoadenosine 5'-phosphosulfate sulfotransferase (PAPS reductase)/FAD synthetase
MEILSGIETIKKVRESHNKTLIAFSAGKDAVAAYLSIRDHFDDVVPYYLYLIPDLEFVEDSLDYYERFFGVKITRLPHPSLHRMLNNFVFQPPERCAVIEQARLPSHDYADIRNAMISKHSLDDRVMVADGVRAADSPMRRIAISQHGPITWSQNKYHPVWDMKKDQLIDLLNKHNCKLSIDYKYFSRSFDGIDLRFLLPIKKHFPRDYQKILDWFPLAELEVHRYEYSRIAA